MTFRFSRARGARFYYLSPIGNLPGVLAALLLFFLPGLLLVRRGEWERFEPIELAGVAFAGSAALWSVAFWALRLVPVSWRGAGLAAVVASAGAILARRGARSAAAAAWRDRPRTLAWQTGFVAAVCALRLAFAATHLAYSGGDMTAHAAITEEIVRPTGFPRRRSRSCRSPASGRSGPASTPWPLSTVSGPALRPGGQQYLYCVSRRPACPSLSTPSCGH